MKKMFSFIFGHNVFHPLKITGAVVAMLLFALPAYADNVTVGCAGANGTFDFSSISAAVNAVPDGSQINVSGTCNEVVSISDRHDLTINGVTGSTTLQAAALSVPDALLIISDSKGIAIQNLELLGSFFPNGTVHIVDSKVNFQGVTIQGAGPNDEGMFIQQDSSIDVSASYIQDNGVGIRVDRGASILLGDDGAAPDFIQRNASYGVWLRNGASAGIFGATELKDNFIGLEVDSGSSADFCCNGGQRKVKDNQVGIYVNNGGSLEVRGPTLISGNQIWGVRLLGASAVFYGSQSIDGNATGLIAQGNSHIDLFGTDVSNNAGSGVVLTDNSSARIYDDSITGNSGAGLKLTRISTAQLFNGNTITANGGVDLTCSPDSSGYGDKSGIGKMACPKFDVEPVPGHPQ